ncbi:hypothetical protein [Aquisalibacillus elongatus]|uniref:Uncharacterized protein n=1 Tax=Aquisalibacillus elongatus TaxID=485577 RepID=A0A3N5B8J5_9BACI|nr:hypothetical protein [Aquisalibacillus elongatus]RPF53319.1 hypothetical protein EDC24_1816 [Aquisalibacillus elongatus]
MKHLVWLCLVCLLLVSCVDEQPEEEVQVDDTGESDDQEEQDHDEEQDSEEEPDQSEDEGEQVEEEEKDEPVTSLISVDQARSIAERKLYFAINTMQNLQEEKQEWFGVEEESEAYTNAVEETKSELGENISSETIDQWAENYFQEFFIYNHLYRVLQPSDLNTRFDLKEFSDQHFVLAFIQLGDGAYKETTEYDVEFVKEDGEWKFKDYKHMPVDEPLDLTFEDLQEAFVDVESLERIEGELVEEKTHEGEHYLVIDYEGMTKAINTNTGFENFDLVE